MQRDLTLVLGGDGTGKTTFVIRNIIPRHSRILIIDAGFGDFTTHPLNIPSFDTLDALTEYLGSLQAFGSQRPFRAAYTPMPDEYDLMFLLARDLGSCLIVAEEADRFNPMGFYESSYVYQGRHWGVSMVGLTIQPFALPKDWRRILKELISFRQIEPDDIKYIAAIIGDAAYEIPKLEGPDRDHKPPFPYLRWTPSEGALIEKNGSDFKSAYKKEPLQTPKEGIEEDPLDTVEPDASGPTKAADPD